MVSQIFAISVGKSVALANLNVSSAHPKQALRLHGNPLLSLIIASSCDVTFINKLLFMVVFVTVAYYLANYLLIHMFIILLLLFFFWTNSVGIGEAFFEGVENVTPRVCVTAVGGWFEEFGSASRRWGFSLRFKRPHSVLI